MTTSNICVTVTPQRDIDLTTTTTTIIIIITTTITPVWKRFYLIRYLHCYQCGCLTTIKDVTLILVISIISHLVAVLWFKKGHSTGRLITKTRCSLSPPPLLSFYDDDDDDDDNMYANKFCTLPWGPPSVVESPPDIMPSG